MSTKTKNVISDAVGDLEGLTHLIQLCGFAAEARRVLCDIADVAATSPAFAAELSSRVDAHAEWLCHEDSLGVALRVVAQQLTEINSRLEGEC